MLTLFDESVARIINLNFPSEIADIESKAYVKVHAVETLNQDIAENPDIVEDIVTEVVERLKVSQEVSIPEQTTQGMGRGERIHEIIHSNYRYSHDKTR